ncbi:hypothetical protein [Microvirga tunisiensis]|uniref:Uncharacterized protein n=1 Tax=Microvirga tunisiensis TaxID=2108360 RepID=A0A5N7MEQ2_9HYPH|nr:hypothetical protein [Microvirga tunisiensis]MPR07107.1 hypothetical protein [Microvirga tunisiensis]MPR25355.1 hypothetical protein [Microvirga tunisiensis]
MFQYQWTSRPVTLNAELSATMRNETQGVEALAVRLFQLTQLEVINQERRGHDAEITSALLKEVAANRFGLIAPILDALRQNNQRKIKQYEDLLQLNLPKLQQNVDDAINLSILQEQSQSRQQLAFEHHRAISSLITMGYDQATAKQAVDRIFEADPNLSAPSAVRQILNAVDPGPASEFACSSESLKSIAEMALAGQSASMRSERQV